MPRAGRLAVLLTVLIAGCGGDEGGAPVAVLPTSPGAGTGVGGVGRGPAPIDLQTAGDYVILAETEITNTGTTVVTGDVGLSPASGSAIGLTCADVGGTIYTTDAAGPLPCRVTDAARLTTAVGNAITAYNDGIARTPDYTELGGGNIGGRNLGPATYKWSNSVTIPANLTLTGGANDVWIFLVTQDLSVSPGVRILLAGGALPQNVYWLTLIDGVELGANSQFRGIILSETLIDMRSGATINGRLLAATAINLAQNVVTQP